jgi:threonine/homoserine/homoserine lactone efflux protein
MPTEPSAGKNYNAAILMDTAKLFVFLTAAFLLAIAPGPGMLYVLARSLAGGKREGAVSALGTSSAAWCMSLPQPLAFP